MSKTHLIPRLLARLRYLPFILVVVVSVPIVGMAWSEVGKLIGVRPVPVPVVGTGSMYPSLFWAKTEGGPEDETQQGISEYRTTPHLFRRFPGLTIFGQTYLNKSLSYGDLVAFKNSATAKILAEENKDTSSGFIKRIIGVPSDTLELRDGFVYKNGVILDEPYLLSPRSTYGGTSLVDCVKLTIPEGNYFVMGDNRKLSSDSRFELGLVEEADITYFLPLQDQSLYHTLWRDTSGDARLLGQPTLETNQFLQLLNQVRNSRGLSPLNLKPKLIQSSALRANDPNLPLQQAMQQADYSNIVLGEFIAHGAYNATELLENLLYQANTAKQVLNPDYTDIGLVAIQLNSADCPHQVIVGHLGGYLPASYDSPTIASWQRLRDNLREVLPSWEAATTYSTVNQEKLSQLLTVLRRRLSLANEIIATMERREWLTADQDVRIKADNDDALNVENLTQELNQE
ncbi:MAG: signal peptidase I [bacterium]